jgi:hypothetical protein
MNAAADAAALAGVTPAMMSSSDAVAKTAAINMFTAQTNTISNLVPGTLVPTVTVTDSGLTRTVNVSYTAQVYNVFGGVLGQQTMPLSGHSQANGATPPNVDFYLVLDTSPSMAIPATQNGINLLVQHTQSQTDGNEKGCAFACHESNPSGSDNAGNPNGEDNYALAKSLTDPDTGGAGITLRIDEVGNAATAMVSSAINTMSQNQSNFGWTPTYRIAINTFDVSLHNLYSLTSNLSTMQSNLNATPSPIQLMEVYSNNNECTNWTTTTSHGVTTTTCTAYTSNNDADTNIDAMLTGMNSAMPTPGDGAVGDSPADRILSIWRPARGADGRKRSDKPRHEHNDSSFRRNLHGDQESRYQDRYSLYDLLSARSWWAGKLVRQPHLRIPTERRRHGWPRAPEQLRLAGPFLSGPGGRGYFRGVGDALPNGVAEFAPHAIASLSIPAASLVEMIGWPTTRGGLR